MQQRLYLLLYFACITCGSFAQGEDANPFMNDANGRPLYLKTQFVSEGSPYLYDSYCFAQITATNGMIYSNVLVKINLAEGAVLYKNDRNEELIATMSISRIKLSSMVLNDVVREETVLEGFNAPLNAADGHVYQVLDSGKCRLLKEIAITYEDIKKYGEANITRIFRRKETLYVQLENSSTLQKAPKNNSAVLELFKDKEGPIRAFIESNRLDCRKESDLAEVFRYFNSL